MTRADEIAIDWETPYEGRPELRRGRSGAGRGAGQNGNGAGQNGKRTASTKPTANGDGTANRDGTAHGDGHPGGPVRRRVLTVDPHGAVRLPEDDALPGTPAAGPGDPALDARHAGSTASVAGDQADNEVVPAPEHDSLPDRARAAAGTWLRAAGWTAGTSLRVSNQLRKLATDPSSAQEVIDEVTREVREVAREFLGISELDSQVQQMAPLLSSGLLRAGGSSPEALRVQGAQLLRAAADVGFDEGAHPAFARMLTELSPDEARILRLLAIEGAQPVVDVRATNLIGNGSQLIAQSLNMLGPQAGLRQRERVPVYLANLARLNLVVLSEDPLDSPGEYQVLEAQPEVLATLRDAARAKTIRRSIWLTPLGAEFCAECLPVNLPTLPSPRKRV